jgi:hypothetical protein
MIIPNYSYDYNGDFVFEMTHFSEDKKELKKEWHTRKTYKNYITLNPLTNEILNKTCECMSFQLNLTCKHLTQSIKQIELIVNGIKEN